MQIAIYSGSFNPIHLGHQKLAEYVLDKKLADEVWLVVTPSNPLKDVEHQPDEYTRMEMVAAAVGDNPRIKVSDVEFTMPVPSYTVDTLKKLTELHPQHRFLLVIGSDNAVIFDQWKEYQQILDTYPVLVYPRKGYDFSTVAVQYPQMQLLDTPLYDISSTQIREMIRKGEDVSAWLHPKVVEYIAEKRIYER